jgi:hypothetical protein
VLMPERGRPSAVPMACNHHQQEASILNRANTPVRAKKLADFLE